MERKIKDHEYTVIQGWMISRLNLTGVELILYALIYGYRPDGSFIDWGTADDDFRAWMSGYGFDFEFDDIDYYLNNLKTKGLVKVTEDGVAIAKTSEDLEK